MSKPTNAALIEHIGTLTIYFDRDADLFHVDMGRESKRFRHLSAARKFAMRRGGHGPGLNIPVTILRGRRDEPVNATLVAYFWGQRRVVHKDGTSETLAYHRKVIHRTPSNARLTRLIETVEAARTSLDDAEKALEAYEKAHALPTSLEELVKLSKPVKHPKGPRS